MVPHQQNYHQNHLRRKNWFCNSVKKTRRHQVDIFLILSWALLTSSARAEGSWTEPINVHALLMGHIVPHLPFPVSHPPWSPLCMILFNTSTRSCSTCVHTPLPEPSCHAPKDKAEEKENDMTIVTRHTLCLKLHDNRCGLWALHHRWPL